MKKAHYPSHRSLHSHLICSATREQRMAVGIYCKTRRVDRQQEAHPIHQLNSRMNACSHRGLETSLHYRRRHMLSLQRFQARLTLFPKYFASFPHGTSMLLDSSTCGVLNGVYHQIGARISASATLRAHAVRILTRDRTGFSPSIIPNAKGLPSASMLTTCCTKL